MPKLADIKRPPAKPSRARLSPMMAMISRIPIPFMRKLKVSGGLTNEEALAEGKKLDSRPHDRHTYDKENGVLTLFKAQPTQHMEET